MLTSYGEIQAHDKESTTIQILKKCIGEFFKYIKIFYRKDFLEAYSYKLQFFSSFFVIFVNIFLFFSYLNLLAAAMKTHMKIQAILVL